jgi:hypothetical protein
MSEAVLNRVRLPRAAKSYAERTTALSTSSDPLFTPGNDGESTNEDVTIERHLEVKRFGKAEAKRPNFLSRDKPTKPKKSVATEIWLSRASRRRKPTRRSANLFVDLPLEYTLEYLTYESIVSLTGVCKSARSKSGRGGAFHAACCVSAREACGITGYWQHAMSKQFQDHKWLHRLHSSIVEEGESSMLGSMHAEIFGAATKLTENLYTNYSRPESCESEEPREKGTEVSQPEIKHGRR